MGEEDLPETGETQKPLQLLPSRPGGPDKWTETLVAAAMSKEPIPVAPLSFSTKEAFDAALTPKEMLAAFPYSTELAIRQLHRELGVARIVGIAEYAMWRADPDVYHGNFVLVPWWVWRYELRESDDFWETGYLLVTYPTKGHATTDYERWIKLFNIRFSPAALPELSAQTSPSSIASKPKDLPFPPKDEVEKFCRAILHGWPLVTENDAHKRAVDWFPNNAVSRDKFRAIFRAIRGPKKPGKPANTSD